MENQENQDSDDSEVELNDISDEESELDLGSDRESNDGEATNNMDVDKEQDIDPPRNSAPPSSEIDDTSANSEGNKVANVGPDIPNLVQTTLIDDSVSHSPLEWITSTHSKYSEQGCSTKWSK